MNTPLKTPCPGCGAPMHAVELQHSNYAEKLAAKTRVVAVCEQRCQVTVERTGTWGYELPLAREMREVMG